ncbi:hypothetical protein [Streptomyces sp. SID3343]|uniref:hypothetical protein n=1 Tax=Streptomyces sp. SID3343 TaxID=2690260 RepID=UPI00136A63CC|nr:hypothetical protein [Streptomyces sp. SID3343]MYV99531.1 hypothetical protein [Streptomyces sp. SID3343]
MFRTRVRALVVAVVAIVSLAGCGLDRTLATPPRSTKPAPVQVTADVRRAASGYASDVAGWIGSGPIAPVSTNTWTDPMECSHDAVGGFGVESTFRMDLAEPLHPAAFERVRAGMRARGITISSDSAGRPGESAFMIAADQKSRYNLRLFSAPTTTDKPESDAIVVEVRSPCFTEATQAPVQVPVSSP